MSTQEETSEPAPSRSGKNRRFGSVISTRPLPLAVERPEPWNRWLLKAIHYWRYGYSHPDEDLLGVIEAIGDSLHVQVVAAKAVLTGARAAEAERIKQELDAELKKDLPDFSTLLSMESRINALYPPAMVRRRQWVIRERFERIAPPGAFQHWQVAGLRARAAPTTAEGGDRDSSGSGPSSAAPDAPTGGEGADQSSGEEAGGGPGGGDGPGGPGGAGGGGTADGGDGGTGGDAARAPLTESEADVQTLLGYIHTNYLMTIGREKAVRDLKRWLLMRFWLFILVLLPILLVVWIGLWLNDMGEYWGLLLGLFLIAAAGRAGAVTSVIRRLQAAISNNVLAADPVIELTALRTGKNEISMALVSASIFALLLWALFASGVPQLVGLEGGLFPRAIAATPQTEGSKATQTAGGTEPDKDAEGGGGPVGESQKPSDPQQRAAATEPGVAPPDAEPPASTVEETPPGEPGSGGTPTELVPARPQAGPGAAETPVRPELTVEAGRRLDALEIAVERARIRYRAEMARLRAAQGWANWFERRRIRHRAREAIATSILSQEEVIGFMEARRRESRTARQPRAALGWDEELTEAHTKLDELQELEEALRSGGSTKPTPGLRCEAGKNCNPFPALATHLRLAHESDFFKMLLWAFIAGFAERFVPDMLDRVVTRSRGTAAVGSSALLAAHVRAGSAPAPDPVPPGPRLPGQDGDGHRSGP